jgi:hypothetical protein
LKNRGSAHPILPEFRNDHQETHENARKVNNWKKTASSPKKLERLGFQLFDFRELSWFLFSFFGILQPGTGRL